VPPGYSTLHVRATGGAGGQPPLPPWYTGDLQNWPPGRGAIVEGDIPVHPGQVLYVLVGGNGGVP